MIITKQPPKVYTGTLVCLGAHPVPPAPLSPPLGTRPPGRDSHLAGDLAEGVLQFAMQNRQLLKVATGLMDGNQDFVDLIDSLVEPTLRKESAYQQLSSCPSRELSGDSLLVQSEQPLER